MKLSDFSIKEACRLGSVEEILSHFEFKFKISDLIRDDKESWNLIPSNFSIEFKDRFGIVGAQIIMPPVNWAARARLPVSKIFEWNDLHGFAWTYISPLESEKPVLRVFHPVHGNKPRN